MSNSNPPTGNREESTTRKKELYDNILSLQYVIYFAHFLILFLAWDCGGSSFDKSLEREAPIKKPDPEPTPAEKIKAFFDRAWNQISPPEKPAYESTWRLSKEEVQLLDIILTLEVKAALSLGLTLEWSEALRLGSQYPFRVNDPNLVTSIKIGEMFTYSKDWEVEKK